MRVSEGTRTPDRLTTTRRSVLRAAGCSDDPPANAPHLRDYQAGPPAPRRRSQVVKCADAPAQARIALPRAQRTHSAHTTWRAQATIRLGGVGSASNAASTPRSRCDAVAERWLARFTARVAAGERRQRTLDAHRYHLHQHVLPRFGARRIHTLTITDVVAFLDALRDAGASEKTRLSALGTLRMVLRYARRQGLIVEDPTRRLEQHERPHPVRHGRAPRPCPAVGPASRRTRAGVAPVLGPGPR
jgi:hypothetical protein